MYELLVKVQGAFVWVARSNYETIARMATVRESQGYEVKVQPC